MPLTQTGLEYQIGAGGGGGAITPPPTANMPNVDIPENPRSQSSISG